MRKIESRERRTFERIPARLSLRIRNRYSNEWALVQTEDISRQGIGLFTEKRLLLRSPLEIWLPIIDKGETFYTTGEVAWSEMVQEGRYRVGVALRKPESEGVTQVIKGMA